MRLITVSLAGLLVLGTAAQAAAQMPTPMLQFDGTEQYEVGGKPWVRYKLSVVNGAWWLAIFREREPEFPEVFRRAERGRRLEEDQRMPAWGERD